ncbi:type IV conjugative transfer system protein TraE (plasmid) [Legionella geestiana]|nr:type IV conjugative transfer system protein TraE [Legionella geestiana]
MDFKVYQSQLNRLSDRLNLMVFLVFGLLVSNVLLSCFVYRAWNSRTVEITPFSGSPGYVKSASMADSHYLSLMSENFINERLNVSPETVDANHRRLLSFVNSAQYAEVSAQLKREAVDIKAKKIASSFDITHIQANPREMTAVVSGVLKRFVGVRALKEERKTCQLRFDYRNGRLSIAQFVILKEKEHV